MVMTNSNDHNNDILTIVEAMATITTAITMTMAITIATVKL